MDCIFCRIVSGEIPADIVYEDDRILAFRDLAPQAPVHVLVIPKAHIASLDDLDGSAEQRELVGYLMSAIRGIAAKLGLGNGYRVVNNCGEDALQTVKHIHFHLLGGRLMGWPPG